jgi:iron complex outermembrane receptor protein
VIVTTNNPTIGGGYDGYLMGHVGNYGDVGAQGAVNLPVNDTLAARVAFNTEYRNSYYHITGPWTGDPDLRWGSARLSLLWKPTDKLKILFKTDYDYLDNGGYFGDPITTPTTKTLFTFANNAHNAATDQFVRSILQADYVNDAGITFRSVSGYQQGKSGWIGDIDGTAAVAPNYIINEQVDEQLWSQEFNIISPSSGPITWVVGAYYDHNDYAFPFGRFEIGVPPGVVDERLDGVNHTYTAAAFGQISFNLPAGFQLQLGGRYSHWSTFNRVNWRVPNFAINFFDLQTETGSNITGKVTLNWNIDRNNFLYAFVASGAKPGGLNGAQYFGGGFIPPPFGQEYVVDYEGGWKSSLLDHHLQTQIGFYYNSFSHFQVIVPIPNDPVFTTETNDPNPTKLYGFEASAEAVFGGLSLNAGLGLEHSSLGKFFTEDPRKATGGTCDPNIGPATATCINLGGHPQTYAPDLTFNFGASYTFKLAGGDTITPNITFSHISHQWGTLFDNVAAGDYLTPRDILGASLAWTHGSIVATLYGTNLTDDRYVSALLSPIRIAGAPRQFGVSLMKLF